MVSNFPAFAEDTIGKIIAWHALLTVEEDGSLSGAVDWEKGLAGRCKQVVLGIAAYPSWINLVSSLAASAFASQLVNSLAVRISIHAHTFLVSILLISARR